MARGKPGQTSVELGHLRAEVLARRVLEPDTRGTAARCVGKRGFVLCASFARGEVFQCKVEVFAGRPFWA